MRPRQTRPRLVQAMIDAFSLPDLRRRLLITILILVIFRFIAHVPMPGVDRSALANLFQQNALLGLLDMFSGGAMREFSVAAMGVYPYITATIIMQLLIPVIPRLQALSLEGEAGKNKMNQISHWLTVPLAGLQGYGQFVYFSRQNPPIITATDALSTATIIVAMIAGTMFCIWLGELITEYGIGNGISIIIFGGIVAGLPNLIQQGVLAWGQAWQGVIFYVIIVVVTFLIIVIFTEAHRRIPVQYARSVFRSGRMYKQSGATHVPLRVNTAGMIPLIFAQSLVIFPALVASYFSNPNQPNAANTVMELFNSQAPLPLGFFYWGLYFLMVIAFAFFYTLVIFQQQDLPGVLQKQGGFVPGIRPGKNTSTYLNNVIKRITWAGALFLGIVAIIPFIARETTGIQQIALSSTGIIIVVGVALDTMKQMEAQLAMRRYEGFIK